MCDKGGGVATFFLKNLEPG